MLFMNRPASFPNIYLPDAGLCRTPLFNGDKDAPSFGRLLFRAAFPSTVLRSDFPGDPPSFRNNPMASLCKKDMFFPSL